METFLVVMLGAKRRKLLASCGQSPGVLLSILQCTGRPHNKYSSSPKRQQSRGWETLLQGPGILAKKTQIPKANFPLSSQKKSWLRRQRLINRHSLLTSKWALPNFLRPRFLITVSLVFAKASPSGPLSRELRSRHHVLSLRTHALPHHLRLSRSQGLPSYSTVTSHQRKQ